MKKQLHSLSALAVSLFAFGFYACNVDSSQTVTVEPSSQAASDTCCQVLSTDSVDSEYLFSSTYLLGDGSQPGHHNISIHDSIVGNTHYAVFRVIKNSSPDPVATLATVKLWTNTVELSINSGNIVLSPLSGSNNHYISKSDFTPFTNDFDAKITAYSPWVGGEAGIVGAEDPRASYVNINDFNGRIIVVNAKPGRLVRISQPTAGGAIRFSTNYTNSIARATASPYCLTGVSRWAKDFSVACP
jgi:hypothetical protein